MTRTSEPLLIAIRLPFFTLSFADAFVFLEVFGGFIRTEEARDTASVMEDTDVAQLDWLGTPPNKFLRVFNTSEVVVFTITPFSGEGVSRIMQK